MDHEDYYKVLQVDPDAEPEVVRAAYRALSRKYHPDGTHPSADRMKQLNDAHAVLSDPQTRARYNDELERRASDFSHAPGSVVVGPPLRYQDATGDSPRPRRAIRRNRLGVIPQVGLVSLCLFALVLSGVLVPRAQPEPQPPSATPTSRAFQLSGQALQAAFEDIGFTFETQISPEGESLLHGSDDHEVAEVYISQQGDSIAYASLMLSGAQPGAAVDQRADEQALDQLLSAAFGSYPGRDEAYDWISTRRGSPDLDDSMIVSGWLIHMWSAPQQHVGIVIKPATP